MSLSVRQGTTNWQTVSSEPSREIANSSGAIHGGFIAVKPLIPMTPINYYLVAGAGILTVALLIGLPVALLSMGPPKKATPTSPVDVAIVTDSRTNPIQQVVRETPVQDVVANQVAIEPVKKSGTGIIPDDQNANVLPNVPPVTPPAEFASLQTKKMVDDGLPKIESGVEWGPGNPEKRQFTLQDLNSSGLTIPDGYLKHIFQPVPNQGNPQNNFTVPSSSSGQPGYVVTNPGTNGPTYVITTPVFNFPQYVVVTPVINIPNYVVTPPMINWPNMLTTGSRGGNPTWMIPKFGGGQLTSMIPNFGGGKKPGMIPHFGGGKLPGMIPQGGHKQTVMLPPGGNKPPGLIPPHGGQKQTVMLPPFGGGKQTIMFPNQGGGHNLLIPGFGGGQRTSLTSMQGGGKISMPSFTGGGRTHCSCVCK